MPVVGQWWAGGLAVSSAGWLAVVGLELNRNRSRIAVMGDRIMGGGGKRRRVVKARRGLAAMPAERLAEVARAGGLAAAASLGELGRQERARAGGLAIAGRPRRPGGGRPKGSRNKVKPDELDQASE